MSLALTIIAIVLGLAGHLMLLVLCIAGMANTNAEQMAEIKRWMLAIGVVGIGCAGGGLALWRFGHPVWAVVINLLSPIVMLALMMYLTSK